MSNESQSKSKYFLWTVLALLVIFVVYNLYSGLTVSEVGIPGIATIKFGEKTPTPAPTPSPIVPMPLYPVCGDSIKYPGDERLIFLWKRVEGASHYTLEVDCFGCGGVAGNWYSLSTGSSWRIKRGLGWHTTIYHSMLHQDSDGAPLRWRVWAIDPEGFAGEKSPWCQVAFIRE